MLFNSLEYLLVFLPVCFLIYFWLTGLRKIVIAKGWLVLASLIFYAWWTPAYLPLLLASILGNFFVGSRLAQAYKEDDQRNKRRKILLIAAVSANIALLGYYKYSGFIAINISYVLSIPAPNIEIALPLAISFFTFTQIVYLIDSYRGETKEYDFLNYSLFVTFFPHLIAGPIVHHREIMPQFASAVNLTPRQRNIALGLFLLAIGLAKKVLVADHLSLYVSAGFDRAETLSFFEAWAASLAYTFQIYFDFSGYTDMALGAALLFNIRLPINFNSPYRSRNIQEFWRCWHITLSRFLRDYVYIPLGGGRRGELRGYINVLVTFLLGGLWHGASWMFVLWGALHGMAMVVYRVWSKLGIRLPNTVSWFITFNFINVSWVIFRAQDYVSAKKVLLGMTGMTGVVLPASTEAFLTRWLGDVTNYVSWVGGVTDSGLMLWLALLFSLWIVLSRHNSSELLVSPDNRRCLSIKMAMYYGGLASISLITLALSTYSEFIYFNF